MESSSHPFRSTQTSRDVLQRSRLPHSQISRESWNWKCPFVSSRSLASVPQHDGDNSRRRNCPATRPRRIRQRSHFPISLLTALDRPRFAQVSQRPREALSSPRRLSPAAYRYLRRSLCWRSGQARQGRAASRKRQAWRSDHHRYEHRQRPYGYCHCFTDPSSTGQECELSLAVQCQAQRAC